MRKTTIVMTTLSAALIVGIAGSDGAQAKGKPGGGGGGGGGGTTADPMIAFFNYDRGYDLAVMDADGGNLTTLV
jgi:hypothetical protein